MPASSEPATTVEQVVTLPKHLHARPAGQVVQAAARYPDTTVELSKDGRTANARSILAVMGLGAVTGDQILVRAAGADPAGALAAVAAILTAAAE
ncbi:MAG TPA: HPr family phosphocarrier protein [Micromonosporaceae bacterium]|nr:HPr family phosphocarrier protein [Micromonosporaceae bacterium]